MNANQQRRWKWAIGLKLLGVFTSGLASFVFITSLNPWNPFVHCHYASPRTTCFANLKMIDGATWTWALENKKGKFARPKRAELFGSSNYIRERHDCPSGGIYTMGSMDEKPRCSVPGHTI